MGVRKVYGAAVDGGLGRSDIRFRLAERGYGAVVVLCAHGFDAPNFAERSAASRDACTAACAFCKLAFALAYWAR